jgi:uncharacterized protein YyaL (SSP411 family)
LIPAGRALLTALALAGAGAASPFARSPSPYLREAASSPIHWRAFDAALLKEAQKSQRPILLDIGAGWCHWCHVMDETTYARPAVVAAISRGYFAAKVDRDLSPEIDAHYQRLAQRLSGAGGWPLTLWLTPSGDPYHAATYLPADQMVALLDRLAGNWRDAPPAKDLEMPRPSPGTAGEPTLKVAEDIGASLIQEFDPQHGGFGRAGPKFPNGPAVQLALALAERSGGPGPLLDVATRTLDGMAEGGFRDHVGGGFHRYSVDPAWGVPHFEKMSYVNAALLQAFLDGYRATGNDVYREVALETVEFLLSEAGRDAAQGGFFASQDADQGPGDDGRYFTWSLEELQAAGGSEAVTFFGARAQPGDLRTDPTRNVLREATLQLHPRPLIEKLRVSRGLRTAPRIDRSKYADWNGMLIVALLQAAAVLDLPAAQEAALSALDLFLARSPGVHRLPAAGEREDEPRRLDDSAQLTLAALEAYQFTGRDRYLSAARALVAAADRQLWDGRAGCYQESTSPLRAFPGAGDNATPAPNVSMARALLRLSVLGGDAAHARRAEQVLRTLAGGAHLGSYGASYGLAVLELREPLLTVSVIGPQGGDPRAAVLREAALASYRPGRLVHPYVAPKSPYPLGPDQKARAYVCSDRSCAPPTSDPVALKTLVRTWGL